MIHWHSIIHQEHDNIVYTDSLAQQAGHTQYITLFCDYFLFIFYKIAVNPNNNYN